MTAAQIRAWLRKAGPSVVLVEVDYMYQVGVGVAAVPTLGTLYFSTAPYVDAAVPRKYGNCISLVPTYTRSLDRSTLRGKYAVSVGSLEIASSDGQHDYLLNLAIDGSEVRVYIGDPTWALTDFIHLFSAISLVASAPSLNTVRITLRDSGVLLNKSIGGMTAVGGTDPSANQFRPINFGFVHQLAPIVYDHTISKYVHSDTGTNTAAVAVRNDGVSVAFMDGGDGTFTLTVPPTGNETITCDVLAYADDGASPSGTYAYRATDTMDWLIGDRCGLDALGLYYGPLTAIDLPDTSPHLGISITEKTKVLDLLDKVTNSHNTFWAVNRTGSVYWARMRPEALSALVAAGRPISAEINLDDQMVGTFRIDHNAPTFTAYQAYGNVNWFSQTTFAPSLNEADRNKYTRKGYYTANYVGEDPGTTSYLGPVSYLGGAPQLYHLTMSDSSLVETLISGPTDASDIDPAQPGRTVEAYLAEWASVRRSQMLPWMEFIDFEAGLDLYPLELGQVVNLIYNRYGLNGGRLFQVCSIGINASQRKTSLGLVHRAYADTNLSPHGCFFIQLLQGGNLLTEDLQRIEQVGDGVCVAVYTPPFVYTPPVAANWNPADTYLSLTLSNGNRTATYVGPNAGGSRGTISHSGTGKYYYEQLWTTVATGSNSPQAGIATAAWVLGPNGNMIGAPGVGSWGIESTTSGAFENGTGIASGVGFANGDVVGIAVDLATGKIWFAKNNVWVLSGNPSTGSNPTFTSVAGTVFPAVRILSGAITANFASTDWVYAAPTGFSEW